MDYEALEEVVNEFGPTLALRVEQLDELFSTSATDPALVAYLDTKTVEVESLATIDPKRSHRVLASALEFTANDTYAEDLEAKNYHRILDFIVGGWESGTCIEVAQHIEMRQDMLEDQLINDGALEDAVGEALEKLGMLTPPEPADEEDNSFSGFAMRHGFLPLILSRLDCAKAF